MYVFSNDVGMSYYCLPMTLSKLGTLVCCVNVCMIAHGFLINAYACARCSWYVGMSLYCVHALRIHVYCGRNICVVLCIDWSNNRFSCVLTGRRSDEA